jgi:DSF synthase
MLDDNAIDLFNRTEDQVQLEALADQTVLAAWMTPTARSCFTFDLLTALANASLGCQTGRFGSFDHWLLGSKVPGVFNFGGDIELFASAIRRRDRRTLQGYGQVCIELVLRQRLGFGLPITTVSLIQGDALGGGAEAALSAQVVVAERGSKIGFPEIMFNLFPGMGAFHLLADRLGVAGATDLLLDGGIHSAEEFHDLGLVDVVADKGEGLATALDHLDRQSASANGRLGIAAVRRDVGMVNHRNLQTTVEQWVDRALDVGDEALRLIDHLVGRQLIRAEPGGR